MVRDSVNHVNFVKPCECLLSDSVNHSKAMKKKEGWACTGWDGRRQGANESSKEFQACRQKRKGDIVNVEIFELNLLNYLMNALLDGLFPLNFK